MKKICVITCVFIAFWLTSCVSQRNTAYPFAGGTKYHPIKRMNHLQVIRAQRGHDLYHYRP